VLQKTTVNGAACGRYGPQTWRFCRRRDCATTQWLVHLNVRRTFSHHDVVRNQHLYPPQDFARIWKWGYRRQL